MQSIRKPAPRRYGRMASMIDSFPKTPMEVPNTTKTAGPMQQEAARNDASMVPMLDMFSFFMR
jgi:hypothetical protein